MASVPENYGVLSSHRRAFFSAAQRGKVAIAVRVTKGMSLRHVGKAYAAAKRIDCKAKTTDFDFKRPDGVVVPGGLVANPHLAGQNAYEAGKFEGARKNWAKFSNEMLAPELASAEALSEMTYVPGGRQYFLELREGDPYWACVKFTSSGLIAAGKPIHGDYDLYDIVPMDTPSENVRTWGKLAGQDHARGRHFIDVQNWVNMAIGYPMILHGSQAKYLPVHEADDGIVVFFPDGKLEAYQGSAAVGELYRSQFGGRSLPRESLSGQDFVPFHAV
ncbi:hypothetical protein [Tropicimonas sp. IMCC6043]|uniref:hypothetical protein n=1 Tax=Tropicimonas sp. IMCC6043 TaxID=2510645 RepID=UPI00101BA4C8|nr:hypothetical protein [Tropicimonas sp. IMCC6043]RYH10291.1 hypothetical protein EU800_08330 [Tropicimonas sp. IMCC6043]